MSLSYVPEHDRLLLRVSTHEDEELRIWWTRRLISLLWLPMRQLAEQLSKNHSPQSLHDDMARRAMQEFKHQEVIQNSDFSTPYKEASKPLLGDEPLLLTEVLLSPTPAHGNPTGVLLRGKGINGAQFDLNLNEQLFHALMHLVEQTCVQAQWWSPPQAGAATEPLDSANTAEQRPKYLN